MKLKFQNFKLLTGGGMTVRDVKAISPSNTKVFLALLNNQM